ncbi:hypothetical protein PG996_005783 [Apiospora saccharicola]|uniref:Uncharacterized protein n=1 Tax=Apiospora saccharicola TaxID=335842 RepID=A0ABR1VMG2_9PEZI
MPGQLSLVWRAKASPDSDLTQPGAGRLTRICNESLTRAWLSAYHGAHLRLERDAVLFWGPELYRFSRTEDEFEAQFRNFMRTDLEVVYIASGNRTVVDLFADYQPRRLVEEEGRVEVLGNHRRGGGNTCNIKQNVTMVIKYDLLQGDSLKEIHHDVQGERASTRSIGALAVKVRALETSLTTQNVINDTLLVG